MPALRIGQIGWGTVGAALGELVASGRLPIELRRVSVRDAVRSREPAIPDGVALVAPDEIATDVDAVVEVAGGTDDAVQWAHAALSAGIPYVTANKALLATCGGELAAVARANRAALLASASVGGGTPMIELLERLAAGGRVVRLSGILNATTNFILTRMGAGSSYDDALAEAQRAGYAEADPSFDVEGRDAAQKLAILASVAWGRWRSEADVERTGIVGLTPRDGAQVRLVAEATPALLRVAPAQLPADSPLANAQGVGNVLEVEMEGGHVFSLTGPGAGGAVTARAVYADLARLVAGERPVLFA